MYDVTMWNNSTIGAHGILFILVKREWRAKCGNISYVFLLISWMYELPAIEPRLRHWSHRSQACRMNRCVMRDE